MNPLVNQLGRRLSLPFIALASFAGYLILARWFPLLPHAAEAPLWDIRRFAPAPGAALLYALLLLTLFGLHALATERARRQPLHPGWILAAAGLLGAPLLFAYPINATDLYRYVIRGRISSVYGASPYAAAPSTFETDPYLPLAGEWVNETSPYGPVWELVAGAVAGLFRGSLPAALIALKSLGLLLHLACAALLGQLAENGRASPGRAAVTLLWAWNPALLLTFVANGHNDALMLLWLLLGAWLLQRGHRTAGLLVMTLAPLTKPIGLLPLPFFWLASLRNQPAAEGASENGALRGAALTLLGSLALAWLAFLPFGSPLALAQRLLREATAAGGFSILALLMLGAQRLGLALDLAALLRAAQLLFAGAALALLWRGWHGRAGRNGAADVFLAYLLTAFSFRIWYAAWPAAFLLGAETAVRRRLGLWLLLTTQLSVLIYGHLRVTLLGGDQLLAHLIGVPFTFGLPFVLAFGAPALSAARAARR